jgi:hypothetical protein
VSFGDVLEWPTPVWQHGGLARQYVAMRPGDRRDASEVYDRQLLLFGVKRDPSKRGRIVGDSLPQLVQVATMAPPGIVKVNPSGTSMLVP